MKEIGGLRFDDVPVIRQQETKLPTYVPLLHHGYSRPHFLQWPVVALKKYSLFRSVGGRYQTIAQSADELRRMFSLDPGTQIILCGVAKDAKPRSFVSGQKQPKPSVETCW
ncbi:MAG: hypothetical protein ABSB74_15095 [Tepidisphaeraceae bacterium]